MKHLGDITKINGHNVPLVDVVCGGSPCQDLSVAGKRAGLAGERSGLFMEQIRIIKEMRDEFTKQLCSRGSVVDRRLVKPRYMVWENVPGAFSSNKGADFHAVLEETAKVADENAVIPGLEGGQKWTTSGAIMGEGWSIAWRVHDAQFWGVPQRRKRISLVADFGGQSAPEILFERKGLSGDIEESGNERKGTATDTERSTNKTSGAVSKGNGVCFSQDAYDKFSQNEKSASLKARGGSYGGGSEAIVIQDVTGPLMASGCEKNGTQEAMNGMYVANQSIVRRLTPLECERLQGYPDGWTDIGEWVDSKGKKHKDTDSPRYKALGNSIALPYWSWMAGRMVKELNAEHPTMASLFDGIGGFPLVFSRNGCEPVWASEIEEFPIAVTKIRFPNEGTKQ